MATVYCVIFPDAQILDIVGPLQMLAAVNDARPHGTQAYTIRLVAKHNGLVRTTCGLELYATLSFTEVTKAALRKTDMLLIAGGSGVGAACEDPEILAFVRQAAYYARRVVSVCSGAFILAAAGVITHERVATHWQSVDALRAYFPRLQVDGDALYVRDGKIWSSAGVTAGIDLALALIREDWGQKMALAIARRHVVFMIRPGGQAQFSAQLQAQAAEGGRLGALLAWISQNTGKELSIGALAARSGMSERTLLRAFRKEVGQSPAEFVAGASLQAARWLLEETNQPLDVIARRAGFGHAERLRRTFQRALGVAPSEYRQRFNASAMTSAA